LQQSRFRRLEIDEADELQIARENTVMTGLDLIAQPELKKPKFATGLHILGQYPAENQFARFGDCDRSVSTNRTKVGLSPLREIARRFGLIFDPLMADPADRIRGQISDDRRCN
jgi:hypothetical protein